MKKFNLYRVNIIHGLKSNPWNIFTPSTPLIYLSIVKSRKILLYKHMAML